MTGYILSGLSVSISASRAYIKLCLKSLASEISCCAQGWCKRLSELSLHYLQTNVFHVFNYYTDLLYMWKKKITLMGAEVPNEDLNALRDFCRHGTLLVLIFSSHKITLILKGTCMPHLLVKKSKRRRKKENKQILMRMYRKKKKDLFGIKEQTVQQGSHMKGAEPFCFLFVNYLSTHCHLLCFLFCAPFCRCYLIPCSQDSWFTGGS